MSKQKTSNFLEETIKWLGWVIVALQEFIKTLAG